MSENQLELISLIDEFNSLHEFCQDKELDRVLELVVRLIVNKGDIPPTQVPELIIELQALSTKFAILAAFYGNMGKGGVREAHLKNVFYTLKEALPKLVDAIKYRTRSGMDY